MIKLFEIFRYAIDTSGSMGGNSSSFFPNDYWVAEIDNNGNQTFKKIRLENIQEVEELIKKNLIRHYKRKQRAIIGMADFEYDKENEQEIIDIVTFMRDTKKYNL